MPFIVQERREAIKDGTLEEWMPGDLCYVYYKDMVDTWKANPRWSTAHMIYKSLLNNVDLLDQDHLVARELAWQVFFIKYVMRYEDVKEEQNGTI